MALAHPAPDIRDWAVVIPTLSFFNTGLGDDRS